MGEKQNTTHKHQMKLHNRNTSTLTHKGVKYAVCMRNRFCTEPLCFVFYLLKVMLLFSYRFFLHFPSLSHPNVKWQMLYAYHSCQTLSSLHPTHSLNVERIKREGEKDTHRTRIPQKLCATQMFFFFFHLM